MTFVYKGAGKKQRAALVEIVNGQSNKVRSDFKMRPEPGEAEASDVHVGCSLH